MSGLCRHKTWKDFAGFHLDQRTYKFTIADDLGGHGPPTKTHQTAPSALRFSAPSFAKSAVNKAIEAVIGHPTKEEISTEFAYACHR
jgi:hypothetical protein